MVSSAPQNVKNLLAEVSSIYELTSLEEFGVLLAHKSNLMLLNLDRAIKTAMKIVDLDGNVVPSQLNSGTQLYLDVSSFKPMEHYWLQLVKDKNC